MKDLDFIRTVVKEWPEGAEFVRLDADGEICFTVGVSEFQNGDFDFYPSKSLGAEDAFIAGNRHRAIGTRYTREQWEQGVTQLSKSAIDVLAESIAQPAPATKALNHLMDPVIEALKVGLTPEQLQALMTSQDGLQLRADTGRAGFIAGFYKAKQVYGCELGQCATELNEFADKHAERVKAGEV